MLVYLASVISGQILDNGKVGLKLYIYLLQDSNILFLDPPDSDTYLENPNAENSSSSSDEDEEHHSPVVHEAAVCQYARLVMHLLRLLQDDHMSQSDDSLDSDDALFEMSSHCESDSDMSTLSEFDSDDEILFPCA